MPLNIKDSVAHEEAKQLAEMTGESITHAVRTAIHERLERVRRSSAARSLADRVREISGRCASRPVLDNRSEDDILGYDGSGLPR